MPPRQVFSLTRREGVNMPNMWHFFDRAKTSDSDMTLAFRSFSERIIPDQFMVRTGLSTRTVFIYQQRKTVPGRALNRATTPSPTNPPKQPRPPRKIHPTLPLPLDPIFISPHHHAYTQKTHRPPPSFSLLSLSSRSNCSRSLCVGKFR